MTTRAGAHRAPALHSPGRSYFWTGLLLIWAFGMALVGVAEAHRHRDLVWAWIFTGFVLIATGLYFWIVHSWLAWIGPTDDYGDVNADVNCPHECDHHPGEN